MTAGIEDCRAIVIPSSPDFVPDIEIIRTHITSRTRAIVTVSPNNPTGVVYPAAVLQGISRLCAEHGLYHISDEAYEYFTFDGAQHYSPGATPGASAYTISLYSLSKSYGMAGWRLGYMALPTHLLPAIKKIQDSNIICATLTSQRAALEALVVGSDYCRQYLVGLDEVRQMVLSSLESLGSRLQIAPARGAFYVFMNLDTTMTSFSICEQLIEQFGVAVIPGSTFGHDKPSVRVAYGNWKKDTIAEGLGRLTKGLDALL